MEANIPNIGGVLTVHDNACSDLNNFLEENNNMDVQINNSNRLSNHKVTEKAGEMENEIYEINYRDFRMKAYEIEMHIMETRYHERESGIYEPT